MDVEYTRIKIPVAGGTIAAGRWGGGEQVVLAAHGITANHLSWQRVAELVVTLSGGEVGVVAVDHRGRAGSPDTPGPFGLPVHADDLIATMDHLGIAKSVFAGHSLGGFIVATAAEMHPNRVSRLVLVDGGLPFPAEVPPDADLEAVVGAVIGPALDRLDQRWPDVEHYVDFFRAHPAFGPPNQWTPAAEAYVRYDAVVTAQGEIRSSVNKEAVLIDGAAVIVDPEAASAIERVTTPAVLVWSPRGLLDASPGLYTPEAVARAIDLLPHLEEQLVGDTNHYTIVSSEFGARDVAGVILGHLSPPHLANQRSAARSKNQGDQP